MNRNLYSLQTVSRLSFLWSIAAIAYIAAISFLNIPIDNVRYVDTILGFVLGTIVSTILNFWLGSSLGSKNKDGPLENE